VEGLAITSTVQTGICGGVGNNLDCADRNLWKGLAITSTDKPDGLLKGLEQLGPDRPKLCSRV
jgi:hypothetical protein